MLKMDSDWIEIKRLASDFKKVQLKSAFQNLSEGNCVEIISLLIKDGFIDVYFTNDGKEYITQEHLVREILSELDLNGGRMNMVDISRVLNIDLQKVENIIKEIAGTDNYVYFVVGQLIGENYIRRLAQEINQIILRNGEVNIADLAIEFDLPKSFIQQHVQRYLQGIRTRQDSSVFFTQAYIELCKLKLKGALTALTRPTAVASLAKPIKVNEQLFQSFLTDVLPSLGSVTSKRSSSIYVPNMFADIQSEWVKSFYKQNGFLDYDTAEKIGITNVKLFVKNHIPGENMLFLKRIAVDFKIINLTLVSAISECVASKSYLDLLTILPPSMSDKDIEELVGFITESRGKSHDFVCFQTTVFSKGFLNDILLPCYEMAEVNAKASIQNGSYQQCIMDDLFESMDKRENIDSKMRRKDLHHKNESGNVSGKDVKNRKGSKRYGNKSEDDDRGKTVVTGKITLKCLDKIDKKRQSNICMEMGNLELVKIQDVETILFKALEKEGLEQFAEDIAALHHRDVNKKAIQIAELLYESTIQVNHGKKFSSLEEKLNTMLNYIRLYENGLKLFPSDVQAQLETYFLKSLGNDICNDLTIYMANECNMEINTKNSLSNDQRIKIAQDCCRPQYKAAILELNRSTSKTTREFFIATESAIKSCNMFIKKSDKRKDRSLVLQHKEKLYQELSETHDHALVLHLTTLIIFIQVSGCILHASGRFISHVLTFIALHLKSDQNELLLRFHDLVLKLSQFEANSKDYNDVNEQLISLEPAIKAIVTDLEKV